MIIRVLALVWKEILAVLRDPRTRISILLPPIIQLMIFTPAATLDVHNVPIGVLNRDAGEQGFEFTQRLQGTPFFNRIIYLKAVEEIQPFVDEQKGVLVISIDEMFSRNLDENKPADLQVILDGRKSNTAQILTGYLATIIDQFNNDFCAKAGIRQQNTRLAPRFWFNPNLLYVWYNIPSLVAVLSMLTCLVVITQSIAREKELGTFDQLLVSPMVPLEIIIGKIIPGIAVGMVEGLFLMAVGVLFYKVPMTGSLPLFVLSQFVFVFSISGIGLFISALCSTQQQAMLGTFVFMMPSILLSGFATPIENMPTWLQPVTFLIPIKYMLVISKGLFLKALPASVVFQQIWPMILIGIFNTLAAGKFFKTRIG